MGTIKSDDYIEYNQQATVVSQKQLVGVAQTDNQIIISTHDNTVTATKNLYTVPVDKVLYISSAYVSVYNNVIGGGEDLQYAGLSIFNSSSDKMFIGFNKESAFDFTAPAANGRMGEHAEMSYPMPLKAPAGSVIRFVYLTTNSSSVNLTCGFMGWLEDYAGR